MTDIEIPTWKDLLAAISPYTMEGTRIHVTDRNQTYIVKDGKYVPEITWTSCAEQMPPNDRSVPALVRLIGDEDIICTESKSVNRLNLDDGYEWTEFTKEKWEALNK